MRGPGNTATRYSRPMLLSDRDLRAEIEAGRLVLDPYDAELIQPSSIDVRLDRYFRVFNNQQYTHIDPATQQDDLTALVDPEPDELGELLVERHARVQGAHALGHLGQLG